MDPQGHSQLQHSLKPRHMSMIALGGVIGAGLFVGSSVVVKNAGPAALISFLITGIIIVLVMRMLGEMASSLPVVGSFYEYARSAFREQPRTANFAGFMTGWMYWYFWVIVVAIEAIAGAKLIQFWLPNIPSWEISLTLMALLTITNLFSVKSYGEFEFWFSSIKVAAIVVFLFLSGLFLLGLWPNHQAMGLGEMMSHGGFMPNGWGPVLSGAVAATGFYFGAEIVTIAAAETADPAKSVARATNSVISRVLFFYVGSIFFVVCLVPWNSDAIATPYVSALQVMQIPYAPHIMNAVILVAVLSCLNSGLYAASRMIFALTRNGDAPKALAKVSGNGVPIRAIIFSTLFGYAAIVVSYYSPDGIFPFLVESYGTVALVVYILIAFSHIRLRRRMERDCPEKIKVRMWCFPYLSYLAIAAMLSILGAMAFLPEQKKAFWFGMLSLLIFAGCYLLRQSYRKEKTFKPATKYSTLG